MNTVTVALDPWEYEWASHVGIRRFTANWGKADAPWYDRERMEDDRTAQVAACVAEIAVAKATNRYWSGSVWSAADHHKHKWRPDVGRNIEVKRVRKGKPAVRQHQVGHNIVLWIANPVAPEFHTVELWGWIHVDEAWEHGTPATYDSTGRTRLVPRDRLRLDGVVA